MKIKRWVERGELGLKKILTSKMGLEPTTDGIRIHKTSKLTKEESRQQIVFFFMLFKILGRSGNGKRNILWGWLN